MTSISTPTRIAAGVTASYLWDLSRSATQTPAPAPAARATRRGDRHGVSAFRPARRGPDATRRRALAARPG
jgi:hypothetical protein